MNTHVPLHAPRSSLARGASDLTDLTDRSMTSPDRSRLDLDRYRYRQRDRPSSIDRAFDRPLASRGLDPSWGGGDVTRRRAFAAASVGEDDGDDDGDDDDGDDEDDAMSWRTTASMRGHARDEDEDEDADADAWG